MLRGTIIYYYKKEREEEDIRKFTSSLCTVPHLFLHPIPQNKAETVIYNMLICLVFFFFFQRGRRMHLLTLFEASKSLGEWSEIDFCSIKQ